MSAFHVFPFAVTLVLSAAALAQEAPAPAPAPPAEASTPHDCAKAMARHDQGAEKATPMPMSGASPMAATASPAKPRPGAGMTTRRSTR